MKLFHNTASPFVRKVMIVAHETGQVDDIELVAAVGHALDTAKMPVVQNPLGKLPTLIVDGKAMYDSRVICRFLNARADGSLYGDETNQWDILTLEATADGILDAAVLMVYEARVRPESIRFPAWVEGQWAKAIRAVAHIEATQMDLLNSPLNIGTIATSCALAYLDFRHPDRDWRADHPKLDCRFRRMVGRTCRDIEGSVTNEQESGNELGCLHRFDLLASGCMPLTRHRSGFGKHRLNPAG